MRSALLLCLVALAAAGCSPGTDPGPCLDPVCLTPFGELSLESWRLHEADSLVITEDIVTATFRTNIGPGAFAIHDAGQVHFNGRPLFRDGDYRLVGSLADLPLRFLPDTNRWVIRGSADVPAFEDAITIPRDRPELLSLSSGDTIRTRDTLRIEWRSATAREGRLELRLGGRIDEIVLFEHGADSSASGVFLLSPITMHALGVGPGVRRLELVYRNEHEFAIDDARKVMSSVELIERYTIIVRE